MFYDSVVTLIKRKPQRLMLWLFCTLALSNSLYAAEVRRSLSLEDKVELLQKQLDSANRMRAEFQFQITNLQNEVRDLRGIIEEQAYQIEQITNRQRDLYKTVDDARFANNKPQTGGEKNNTEPAVPETPEVTSNTTRPQTTATTEEEVRAVYDSIFPLVRSKRFDEAITKYQEFINNYPESGYVSNARYWLAQIFSVQGRTLDAEQEYLLVAQQYPQSSKAPDAWLKLGQLYETQGKNPQAIEAYQQLLNNYADSNAARFAENRLSAIQ